ncbi:MAG: GNAT family N-acetyltransferase [Cocleimonas sp.]|nr:GNAT family N-acetyltransferase [Cocleimonas sp.]
MTHNAPNLLPIGTQALSLRLVNSVDEFKSLQKNWDNLYDKCDKNSVFSSWDWVFTWWEVFKDQFERELFILCFYQGDMLVGIAPFQICKGRFPKSLLQGKTLQFIGNGEAYEDSIVSESQDFIVLPELEAEMVSLVSEYLVKHSHKWNFADFEFLLKDALILQCFDDDGKEYNKNNSQVARQKIEYGVRFSIPKMESYEEYQSKMGGRWRKMLGKKGRKLARDGEVRTESAETLDSIKPALIQLAEMNCYRWKEKTGSCIFDSSRFVEFHQKVMARLIPKNRAIIKTLYLDDNALASYYTFSDKGRIHYYQSGFYAKYANKYSPLFLLVCNEIGESIKNNQMFDFMFADDKNSYKKDQYCCEYESMYRLRWTSQPIRFSAYSSAKKIQNNVQHIKSKLAKLKNKN